MINIMYDLKVTTVVELITCFPAEYYYYCDCSLASRIGNYFLLVTHLPHLGGVSSEDECLAKGCKFCSKDSNTIPRDPQSGVLSTIPQHITWIVNYHYYCFYGYRLKRMNGWLITPSRSVTSDWYQQE